MRFQIEGRRISCSSNCIIRNADKGRQARAATSIGSSDQDCGPVFGINQFKSSILDLRLFRDVGILSDVQLGQERREGAAPMTQGELGLQVNLGHGALKLGQIEERVVTESAGAARSIKDDALDGAIG